MGGGTTVDELLKKIDNLQTELNKVKTQVTTLNTHLSTGRITHFTPTSGGMYNLPSGAQWGSILHFRDLNA